MSTALDDQPPSLNAYRRHLLVCTGARCDVDGRATAMLTRLQARLAEAGATSGPGRVKITRTQCFAVCRRGPIACLEPEGVWLHQLTPENADRLVDEHLLMNQPVEDLIFHRGPGVDPTA